MQIAYLLQSYTVAPKKRGSERGDVIGKIFELYDSEQERTLRKKENWKRYVSWLKQNKRKNEPHSINDFKKSKIFLRPFTIKKLCFLISHLKTVDLYYVLSVCKDKYNRNESIGAYIYTQVINKPKLDA